jgi:hypothetical protein
MAGWGVIEDLAAGAKTLVREPLWTEIRRAAAERRSAQAVFDVAAPLSDDPPVLVARRDAVGSIRDYRIYVTSGLLAGGEPTYQDYVFAQECEAAEAVFFYACKRFLQAATESWAVPVFAEAGLPGAWWTHAPMGLPDLLPSLPYGDVWTDFRPVLNCLTFLALESVALVDNFPDYEFGESLHGDEWPATRAAAWTSIPNGDPMACLVDVGRRGLGAWNFEGEDEWFDARVACRAWYEWAMDLSPLWQVRHLDRYWGEVLDEGDGTAGPYSGALAHAIVPGSLLLRAGTQYVKDDGLGSLEGAGTGTVDYDTADVEVLFNRAVPQGAEILADYDSRSACDPVRLVFYLWHRPWTADDVACSCTVKLSGDGGTTWETLGTLETVPATTEYKCEKYESTAPARWTADTVLRVEYAGDVHADTPGWPAPAAEEPTEYEEAADVALSTPFAEFDWNFKGP